MAGSRQLTPDDLRLMVQALEDAVFYRDARLHVLKVMVRRRRRGGSLVDSQTPAEDHEARAKAYAALALKLKAFLEKPE
jgi:hypothetical protein